MRMPFKHISTALSLTPILWTLLCGNYLWTWGYHGKHNKSTVSWKLSQIDTSRAIEGSSSPMVCPCYVTTCDAHFKSHHHKIILIFSPSA